MDSWDFGRMWTWLPATRTTMSLENASALERSARQGHLGGRHMADDTEKSNHRQPILRIDKDLEALLELIRVAKVVLGRTQTGVYERTLRYFGISLSNSSVAVAILCDAGHGADAVKIARSMFETHVTFQYLLGRRQELKDFLDFDAVARYKRLQYYKSTLPQLYASFPAEKINSVNNAY